MNALARVKSLVPWHMKIAAKLVLSRMPADYRMWQRLSLFRHGSMDEPKYAYGVFRTHLDRSDFARKHQGFVGLELGPGDSLFSCMIAKALGATKTWMIDSGHFARADGPAYHKMAQYLETLGLQAPAPFQDLAGMLASCDGVYGVDGLQSLRAVPSGSVDLIWSHAVLEHIRRADFLPIMQELRRVVREDGVCSHRVDLRDHLGGALNNLRFPDGLWEADWMARSGFYTNRIQFEEMCELFDRAGFNCQVLDVVRWPTLPTPRERLAEPFRSMHIDSLLVSGFDVLLHPR